MLWNLGGEKASHVYSALVGAIKLKANLYCGVASAETDILGRYAKFFRGLKTSTSQEVQVLFNLVSRDLQSTTGKNLRLL